MNSYIFNNILNLILDTDSYKMSHYRQYPKDTQEIISYIEARGGKTPKVLFFGLQYILKEYLTKPVSMEEVDYANEFSKQHGVPFHYEGWKYIVEKHNGYLPIEVRAVEEGLRVPLRNVLMTIRNTDDNCYWLVNYLETMLLRVWYPTTVATLSNLIKQTILEYEFETCDNPFQDVAFKVHDFGSRGVSCREQAMIGGMSHLVNFSGSDTVVGVLGANVYYNHDKMSGFSIPACYSDDTEILTNKGYKLFENLTDSDKVAQYCKNGIIKFVKPTKFYKYDYKGDMYNFHSKSSVKKVDLLVSDKHRMISRTKENKINVDMADTIKYSDKNKFILSGKAKGEIKTLSMIDRLAIAFQADGSFYSRKEKYNGKLYGLFPIRFSLKKDRKQKRLKWILDSLSDEIYYSVKKIPNRQGYEYFDIRIPMKYIDKITKIMNWVQYDKISDSWANEFIEEVSHWDSTIKNNSIIYTSTVAENAEIVSIVATLGGNRLSISKEKDNRDSNRKDLYVVGILKNITDIGGQTIIKEKKTYNGNIYCVSVPSGMVVVRRKGLSCISGNSEHSTITSWTKDHEVDAYRNFIEKYFDYPVIACVMDSYDIYNSCENMLGGELKELIEKKEGVFVARPDSGDPVQIIFELTEIFDKKFGHTVNKKGYKVLNHMRMLQGDGINIDTVKEILHGLKLKGWSCENVNFGIGGALLQRDIDRDTFKFATKCCAIRTNNIWKDVYKDPINSFKKSKKGRLALKGTLTKNAINIKTVRQEEIYEEQNLLKTVFKDGKLIKDYSLDEVKANTELIIEEK